MKEQAHQLFIHFLNRSFYIKSHLSERLDELSESILPADFQPVLTTTLSALNVQLDESNKWFEALGTTSSMDDFEPVFHLLENIFTKVQSPDNAAPLISLLDYISIADSLLAETAKMADIHRAPQTESNLTDYPLYVSITLQPLKTLLEETIVVV